MPLQIVPASWDWSSAVCGSGAWCNPGKQSDFMGEPIFDHRNRISEVFWNIAFSNTEVLWERASRIESPLGKTASRVKRFVPTIQRDGKEYGFRSPRCESTREWHGWRWIKNSKRSPPSKGGQVHSTGLQPARQANRISGSLVPCSSARARLESPHPAWNQIAG